MDCKLMKNILIISFCLFTSNIFAQHVYPQSSGGGATFNVISPSQLTAAADDWNPASLSTASVIRLSGDNQFRIISGITAPASAKMLTLTNVGSYAVLITREDAASSSANRFVIYRDLPIYPNQSITFFYDATTSKWKLMDSFPYKLIEGKQFTAAYSHTGSATSADYDSYNFTTGGGSFSTSAADGSLPRRVTMSTGTSASATPNITHKGASIHLGKTTSTPNANATRVVMQVVTALSDATNTYTVIAGMPASVTTATPDGAYFKYSHGVNGGKWQCVTRTGGVETTIDTGVTVDINTTYTFDIYHRPDNSVAFFLDDVYIGESTTNIHDGFAFNSLGLIKSAGTTARVASLLSLEYLESRR